jgi:outer membrane protein TolC
MTRLWLAVIITVLAVNASAQEPVVRLTLEEALARGVESSQRLAELRARGEAAEAVEAGRQAAMRPVVSAVGGYTRTNHVDEFGITQPGQPARIIYPDVPDNYRARLDLQWPIYTAGRADALERAAHAERQAAGADLAAARADLRLEIARAFWALVTADQTELVLARSLEGIDAHVRDLASRLDQGLIPPNELLSAETQQSRERLFAIEARNTRAVSQADLRRLIGGEGNARLEPMAAFDAPAAPLAPADTLVARALGGRPERQALENRASAARAREQAAGAAFRPQVTLDAGYDLARPNPRIFPRVGQWNDSWDVSVNGRWRLWDGGRAHADRAEAAAGVRAADARIGDLDRQLAFEVRQRWLEVDSSRAAILAADDGVRSATEARRVVAERFSVGVATSTERLDAEIALLQAALDRTRAVAGARLAEARLERAVGRP